LTAADAVGDRVYSRTAADAVNDRVYKRRKLSRA
jgi:hypothetical protein